MGDRISNIAVIDTPIASCLASEAQIYYASGGYLKLLYAINKRVDGRLIHRSHTTCSVYGYSYKYLCNYRISDHAKLKGDSDSDVRINFSWEKGFVTISQRNKAGAIPTIYINDGSDWLNETVNMAVGFIENYLPELMCLHESALELAESASVIESTDPDKSNELYERAYILESVAADCLKSKFIAEPIRGTLYLTASWFAYWAGLIPAARELAQTGLSGFPPDDIQTKLQDLLELLNQS